MIGVSRKWGKENHKRAKKNHGEIKNRRIYRKLAERWRIPEENKELRETRNCGSWRSTKKRALIRMKSYRFGKAAHFTRTNPKLS